MYDFDGTARDDFVLQGTFICLELIFIVTTGSLAQLTHSRQKSRKQVNTVELHGQLPRKELLSPKSQ